MGDARDGAKLGTSERWARFRFSVIGQLLSSPPPDGELKKELEALSDQVWVHPISGKPRHFSVATIERWYYTAKAAPKDPVGRLQRPSRKDAGSFVAIVPSVGDLLRIQHAQHPTWSYQLHFENLAAALRSAPELGALPSYTTVRRYMQRHGLFRQKRHRRRGDDSGYERREVRSFEVEHPDALWHLDFHHGKKKVLSDDGAWLRPIAVAILDDFSRLVCHVQWYLEETAEVLVHALIQAILRHGLPRALLSDNGSPMLAEEVTSGLLRLGIVHHTTLPYSPHQNGKQETWFGSLEGRLIAMLREEADLSLRMLNDATAAWVHADYNRKLHQAIGMSPLDRFLQSEGVGRPSPSAEDLRTAFRRDVVRTVRRSDGTISLEGARFEIPHALINTKRVRIRYATWDLSQVHLVDERTGQATRRIYPIDRSANADGRRKPIAEELPPAGTSSTPLRSRPPLLEELLRNQARSGSPPAYMPKHESQSSRPWSLDEGEQETTP
jgi:transposase InsO family protein